MPGCAKHFAAGPRNLTLHATSERQFKKEMQSLLVVIHFLGRCVEAHAIGDAAASILVPAADAFLTLQVKIKAWETSPGSVNQKRLTILTPGQLLL